MQRKKVKILSGVERIRVDLQESPSLHQRYIYRGYLQVAACDLTRGGHPCLWLITWDPTQPIATRPLAIQKDGTWYCYGWDLTKNICEVYGQAGYIRTTYSYTPYGTVTANGDIAQPLQWSSEYADSELGLVYYNYRYYNPNDGRWIRRDPIGIEGETLLYGALDSPMDKSDRLGLKYSLIQEKITSLKIHRVNYLSGREQGRVVYVPVSKSTTSGSYFGRCSISFQGRPSMYIEILVDSRLISPYDVVLKHEYEHARIIKKAWNRFANRANQIKEGTAILCCDCINASKKYLKALREVYDAEFEYENAKLEEKDHSATPHNVSASQNKYEGAKRNEKEARKNYEKECK